MQLSLSLDQEENRREMGEIKVKPRPPPLYGNSEEGELGQHGVGIQRMARQGRKEDQAIVQEIRRARKQR